MAKNESTSTDYLGRARRLIDRMKADLGIDDVAPQLIADWAISLRAELRPASWRQYRAALVYYFSLESGTAAEQAIALLQTADSSVCLKGKDAPSRTSSSKKKQISPDELAQLVEFLEAHKTRWNLPTSVWLQASVLTGLRPNEWLHARLVTSDEGDLVLAVENAKNTNGRANGKERHLVLTGLTAGQQDLIEAQLKVVAVVIKRKWQDRWYSGCRKSLYLAARTLWPQRKRYPTIYSGRHQFIADSKRSGLTKIEIAALAGHGSMQTAGRHYGKKRSGINEVRITPRADDIARLERKHLQMQLDRARPDIRPGS